MKNDPDVESDNNDDAEEKAHKQFFNPPNLTCFKKKDKD